jgi:bifunctional DNA-binding transcriptional regulator/antitoxin component of YhaV-PrlF toxin-antitoxin module
LAGEESALKKMTATVGDIHVASRTLTLKTADGRLVPLKVGKEVRNLANIKKGDIVELDYFEAIEFEVRAPTEEERQLAGIGVDLAARAAKGERPAALAAGERVDILVIESIDRKKELITLKGPQGFVTVKAKYPQNLKVVKVGDTVVVRTSELLAARVKPIG